MQEKMSAINKLAWEAQAYQAWHHHFGTPEQLARDLRDQHRHVLRYWLKDMGELQDKRILQLLGSNGRKAIALAMLGAAVTVVDISAENRRYALETAAAANVEINYICADAMAIPRDASLFNYDYVLMEFGILHYFSDLHALFSVVHERLKSGGRLFLTDFHPFARAFLQTDNLKQPSGQYFDPTYKEGEVAFNKLLPATERCDTRPVLIRSWTLGDIITAIGSLNLKIRSLEEIPAKDEPHFPAFYTLIVDK